MEHLTTKLQVAPDGVVWHIRGDCMPTASGMDVERFLSSTQGPQACRVRVLGSAVNAPLIARLYELQDELDVAVELGTSLLAHTPAVRADPRLTLLRMRTALSDLAVSLGGWHAMAPQDYPAYAIAAELRKGKPSATTLRRLLLTHPAWPALSFIPNLNSLHTAVLLGLIRDPRWYVDRVHPNRSAKLLMALHLTPHTMEAVLSGECTGKATACHVALKAWQTERPPDGMLRSAGYFLWRREAQFRTAVYRALRPTQSFVNYLRYNWLDAIYARRHHERLFVPSYFFTLATEADAFRQHLATVGA